MLMFHEYLRIPHVDRVYWTLTVELTFYFWIFLLYLSSNLNKVAEVFSLLVVVSVLHSLDVISVPAVLYKIFILEYISLFLAGICFYKLVNDMGNKTTMIALALSLLSAIPIYSINAFMFFACFYLVFYLAVSGHLKILRLKPLVFLGSISYSLYLLHQNFGYIIINKAYDLQLNPLIGISSAIAASIILSILFMKFIEKPALRVIRGAYKRKSGKS